MTAHLICCVWEAQSTAFLFSLHFPIFSSTLTTAMFNCDTLKIRYKNEVHIKMHYKLDNIFIL